MGSTRIWFLARITLYLIIGATCGFGFMVFVDMRYTPHLLAQPKPCVLFVDPNDPISSMPPPYGEKTGSLHNPFHTISDAVAAAHGPTTIIVAPGLYKECVTLRDGIILHGVGVTEDGMPSVTITDDPALLRFPLTTAHNTAVINVHIKGGRDAVVIPYGTHTHITRAVISSALEYGVLMGSKKDRAQDTENNHEAERYDVFQPHDRDTSMVNIIPQDHATSFTITQSRIVHNAKQGLYLRDGIVKIHACLVEKNGEEGIDLHPHTKTVVTNTIARNNGESGLETEIYDTDLTVENSTFSENGKNGLAFLTSVGTGKVTLNNLTITNNATYGIRCARHAKFPRTPRPFFASVITTSDLTFANNGSGEIAPPCDQF